MSKEEGGGEEGKGGGVEGEGGGGKGGREVKGRRGGRWSRGGGRWME